MTAPDYRTVTTQDNGTSGVGDVAQGARDRGMEVGEHAKTAAADVKDSAAERAKDVAGEARAQARDLVGHTRDTLVTHADEQTGRLGDTLDQLAGELRKMASSTDQNGLAGRVVSELAERADDLAHRVRGRSSTDLLDDLREFGRRRPGAFLAGAAGLGLLAGRLGRGLKDAKSSDESDAWATTTYGSGYPAGTSTGAAPVGTGYATPVAGDYVTPTSGDYTSGSGAVTPGAGTEYGTEYGSGYGTGAGLATPPATGGELGSPSYDPTALELPDRDVDLTTTERDRTTGGSGYGA